MGFKNLSEWMIQALLQNVPVNYLSLQCCMSEAVPALAGKGRQSLRQSLTNQLHTKCTESVSSKFTCPDTPLSFPETLHYTTCASSNMKINFS